MVVGAAKVRKDSRPGAIGFDYRVSKIVAVNFLLQVWKIRRCPVQPALAVRLFVRVFRLIHNQTVDRQ